jgi:hypothetical protein
MCFLRLKSTPEHRAVRIGNAENYQHLKAIDFRPHESSMIASGLPDQSSEALESPLLGNTHSNSMSSTISRFESLLIHCLPITQLFSLLTLVVVFATGCNMVAACIRFRR